MGIDLEIDRILDSTQHRVEDLATNAVDSFLADIAPYARSANPALTNEVTAHVVAHMGTFLRVARERRPARREDLAFVREPIVARARQGFPLDAILHALRIGHRTVWDAIQETAADTAVGRDAILALTPGTFEYIDIAGSEMTRVYVTEQARAVRATELERRDVMETLLSGQMPPASTVAATEVARLPGEHGLVLLLARALAGAETAPERDLLPAAADVIATGLDEPFVVVRQREIVALVAVDAAGPGALYDQARTLQREAYERSGQPLTIAVSAAFAGLGDVARAYRDAAAAVRSAGAGGGVVIVAEMSPFEYLLANDDGGARAFAAADIERLREADHKAHGALRDTLLAYADADLNVTRAAEALFAHPNTVHYRLRRITEASGRDPRTFAGLVDLLTLLRLAER